MACLRGEGWWLPFNGMTGAKNLHKKGFHVCLETKMGEILVFKKLTFKRVYYSTNALFSPPLKKFVS